MIRLDLLGVFDRILRAFMNLRNQSISAAAIHQYTAMITDATANCMMDCVERQSSHRSLGNTRMRMKAAQVWEMTLFVLHRLKITTIDVTQCTQAIMSMLEVLLAFSVIWFDTSMCSDFTEIFVRRIHRMRCRLVA